jgi:hypothetical protein
MSLFFLLTSPLHSPDSQIIKQIAWHNHWPIREEFTGQSAMPTGAFLCIQINSSAYLNVNAERARPATQMDVTLDFSFLFFWADLIVS